MSDNIFNDHRDHCNQCKEQPSNLCPAGKLLRSFAAVDALRKAGIQDLIDRDNNRPRTFEELFNYL